MSLLDVAPIIEQMLAVSDNVSDLNFSCGQSPQVEINGTLYSASPLGLGRLSAYQTEMIAMAILRDNAEQLQPGCVLKITFSGQKPSNKGNPIKLFEVDLHPPPADGEELPF